MKKELVKLTATNGIDETIAEKINNKQGDLIT
jgi:hypothetical protein